MKPTLLTVILVAGVAIQGFCQGISVKHDPKHDVNLSPTHNSKINPLHNSQINPKFNWNINPQHNQIINPLTSTKINPQYNPDLNPMYNKAINPMFANHLHPKNSVWTGLYLFNAEDKLLGFVTMANQDLLLCFDEQGQWTCYYVKSPTGTYNQFSTTGEWTGSYLCADSGAGFNLFAKTGEWTGMHIK